LSACSEAEVLSLFAAIVRKLKGLMEPEVPKVRAGGSCCLQSCDAFTKANMHADALHSFLSGVTLDDSYIMLVFKIRAAGCNQLVGKHE
jgi:hypothetical protein